MCVAALRVAGRTGLLVTGLLYTAAMGDIAVRTNVYGEMLMALPVALGMLVLAAGLAKENRLLIAGAGFCGGLALLTKQTAAVNLLAMAVVVALVWGRGAERCAFHWSLLRKLHGAERGALGRLAKDWVALGAGVLVAALPWLAYLWRHQAGAEFGDSFVSSGAQYVARISAEQVLGNLGWSLVHVMPRYTILLLASVSGCVYLVRRARQIHAAADAGPTPSDLPYDRGEAIVYVTVCAWYISAIIAVAATGRFAAHYFSQLFPVAALLGGIWIAHKLRSSPVLGRPGEPRKSSARLNVATVALVALLLVLVPVVGMNISHWRMSLAVTAAGSSWRQVGEYVRDHTAPDDTVLVWGDQTEVVYWAGRELATRNPWMTLKLLGFSHEGPLFASRVRDGVDWAWLAGELDSWRPAYVVTAPELLTVEPELARQFGPAELPELREILAGEYRHETDVSGYGLYVRRE